MDDGEKIQKNGTNGEFLGRVSGYCLLKVSRALTRVS